MTKFLIETEKKHNRSNKKQRCHIFLIDFVAASFLKNKYRSRQARRAIAKNLCRCSFTRRMHDQR